MSRRTAAVVHALLVASTLGLLLWTALGPTPPGLPGQGIRPEVRNVDVPRILRMIQQNQLSDHEARWWRPAGPPPAAR
jgi:hypothetical protein